MQISRATKVNIEGILALQPQVYRVDKVARNAQVLLSKLIDSPDCDVIVASEKGKVIGSAFIFYLPIPAHGAACALLEGLVVDKSQRGQGVGTALANKCVEVAKQKGAYKIIFTSGTDRPDAHKFYEKLGFKKWGSEFRMNLK